MFRKIRFWRILALKKIDVRLTNDVNNLATNGQVVFGTVDLNDGKGYNPSNGLFSAPASGVYVFDWTTMTQKGKTVYTSLFVNGKKSRGIIAMILYRRHIGRVAK